MIANHRVIPLFGRDGDIRPGALPDVLVPDFYRRTSAFLCQADEMGERVPRATAFFVSVAVGTCARYREVVYIVTAAHNVQMARANGRPLYLRFNLKDGTVEDVEIPEADWFESGETDLAVCRLPAGKVLEDYDHQRLLPEQLVRDEVVAARRIGPGDEVFFCGLFAEHPGRAESQPIVRWGNVSMMPGEKVRVKTPEGGTRLVDAYLVEARSWGGQSGSPAFVFFPPDRELGVLDLPKWSGGDPGAGGKMALEHQPMLLGVVQGHFDIDQDVTFRSGFDDQATVPVNAGIAVVIPAQKIIDALGEDEFVKEREESPAG